MERIVHKSKSFKDAESWDIQQQISMTPEERQKAAKFLKEKYYGKKVPDIRKFKKKR
jgi:exonuclease III